MSVSSVVCELTTCGGLYGKTISFSSASGNSAHRGQGYVILKIIKKRRNPFSRHTEDLLRLGRDRAAVAH